MRWKCIFVTCVFVLDLCWCLWRSVHISNTSQSCVFLTCWKVSFCNAKCPVRTKALTSTMTVCSINQQLFLFYAKSLLLFDTPPPSQVITHACVHRIVYYKRLYINQSTYYIYKWRAERFQCFYPWYWARTCLFFVLFGYIKANGQNIKALAAIILKW